MPSSPPSDPIDRRPGDEGHRPVWFGTVEEIAQMAVMLAANGYTTSDDWGQDCETKTDAKTCPGHFRRPRRVVVQFDVEATLRRHLAR